MGSSETPRKTDPNQNNVYVPNLLARQIIGDVESKEKNENNYKNKIEQGTLENNSNNEKVSIDNNKENNRNNNNNDYINKKNDFAFLNNEEEDNDNGVITNINKGYQYNKNKFVAHTAEAIKMEITNQKQDLDYRKFKFNGITVVQNLRDYIPENISREEIKEMIFNAFGDGLVDDDKYYIPGKTITRKQANAIVDLIQNHIKEDSSIENLEYNSILKGVNLIIDLVDLNKDIIKKKMFKGQSPTNIQLDNILKNLSQGLDNVKILSIEFI